MAREDQFRTIKGVRDILPPESALWNRIEQAARNVFATYRFHEILMPILEQRDLFARSVGADTEIVSKEMFVVEDWPLDLPDPRTRILTEEELQAVEDAVRRGELPDSEANRTTIVKLREELVQMAVAQTSERFTSFVKSAREYIIQAQSIHGQLLALRPEVTASVVRAYIEHGMHTLPGDVKLYCMGPMFRRERPQKGRYRQFYQIDAEVLGQSDNPGIDAEVIEMLLAFLDRSGLEQRTVYVNSIGDRECRPKYVELLRGELQKVKDKLGADSQRRIETNPLRVLDSKLPEEQAIIEKLPRITDYLCEDCRKHFAALKDQLKLRGIAYQENWRLVRGLDYYMRTTFEITAPGLGAQNAVCGGGRYDGLVELLGGPPTKGIGFALGTDRLILALQEAGKGKTAAQIDVFVAWLGAAAYPMAVRVARTLRNAGFAVELPHEEMKFKKSLGLADRLGARFAVILGDDEVAAGTCTVKRLADAAQVKIAEAALVEHLRAGSRQGS